jgi:hypothetical protein
MSAHEASRLPERAGRRGLPRLLVKRIRPILYG